MHDDYSHEEYGIAYIDENIPGPKETSTEYNDLIVLFSSQLAHNCQCDIQCENIFCDCLKISGGANYTFRLESKNLMAYKLNEQKDVNIYPIIECNELCKCSQECGNRLVQKGPNKSLYVSTCESTMKGLGLFTKSFIAKGSFICEYAGEVLTKSEVLRRHKYNQAYNKMNYIFCLNEHVNDSVIQTFIDPSKFGNIGRYINHSCQPTCKIIPVRVNSPIPKLAIFSCEDIKPNNEITFDYSSHNLKNPIVENLDNRKNCLCKSDKCRGFMPYDIY